VFTEEKRKMKRKPERGSSGKEEMEIHTRVDKEKGEKVRERE